MNKIDYLIVRSHSPSIVRWDKYGVMLVNKLLERNISEMFKIDPFETIFLLEEYMEQCENIKHLIQLNEVLEYFNEKLEDRQ